MFRRRRTGEAADPAALAADPAATPLVRAATAGNRYRMVEQLVSFGDDFSILNDQGQRAFKVDGKALRMRDTLVFRDMQGNEICKIQQRTARVRDSMEIECPGGQCMAMVHKAMITPIRDRYVVKVDGGPDLDIQGTILAHDYASATGAAPQAPLRAAAVVSEKGTVASA